MKTSVSLAVFQAPEGMPALFSGADDRNLGTIKELGYDGVDLFVREPASEATTQAMKGLREYGLGVGAIMPAALAREGLFLGDAKKEVRDEAVRRIGEIVQLAAQCGGMVSLGLVRGSRSAGETDAELLDRFLDSSEKLLKISEPLGVPLVIEPINRYEINTLNSLKETGEFIRGVGLPLFIMADTFHMNIEDVDLEETMRENLPLVKHIHFVDSNRRAPSMGHLDLASMYRMLEREGYSGYLCLETLPLPDPYTCAAAGAAFFRKMSSK